MKRERKGLKERETRNQNAKASGLRPEPRYQALYNPKILNLFDELVYQTKIVPERALALLKAVLSTLQFFNLSINQDFF